MRWGGGGGDVGCGGWVEVRVPVEMRWDGGDAGSGGVEVMVPLDVG